VYTLQLGQPADVDQLYNKGKAWGFRSDPSPLRYTYVELWMRRIRRTSSIGSASASEDDSAAASPAASLGFCWLGAMSVGLLSSLARSLPNTQHHTFAVIAHVILSKSAQLLCLRGDACLVFLAMLIIVLALLSSAASRAPKLDVDGDKIVTQVGSSHQCTCSRLDICNRGQQPYSCKTCAADKACNFLGSSQSGGHAHPLHVQ
jgi:hypothetical protein